MDQCIDSGLFPHMFQFFFLKADLNAVCFIKLHTDWQYMLSMKFYEMIEPYIGKYTLIVGNEYGESNSTFYIEKEGK